MASAATSASENVVVVAVRAEREISKTALAWALTHIVRPGDVVTLLAVLSDGLASGWRRRLLWGFPRFGGDGGSRRREQCQVSASCSQMALQIDGRNEINVRIKVVGSEPSASSSSSSSSSSGTAGGGVVVAESKRVGANWVVLDKNLKQEQKRCLQELQCNIVVMNGSSAKVLRLNLGGIHNKPLPPFSLSSAYPPVREKFPDVEHSQKPKQKIATGHEAKKTSSDKEIKTTVAISSGKGPGNAAFLVREHNPLFERLQNGNGNGGLRPIKDVGSDGEGTSDSHGSREQSPVSAHLGFDLRRKAVREEFSGFHPCAITHHHGTYWIPENHVAERNYNNNNTTKPLPLPLPSTTTAMATKTLQERFEESTNFGFRPNLSEENSGVYNSNVREAVSLFRSSPSVPPPLCSLCRHKTPAFGKPPRRFTYAELEEITEGFADGSFVAEGASGSIHRGVLEDGQVVAVKQLKAVGDAGVDEFCTEVEVLSRAQHRNVVMLVGFCIEEQRRVLVYEYICNGSMNLHLHGQAKQKLDWHARLKIALGVARGLRYLHEDCRVGFVVHKDMRPNNILITHDYEPLIGDFKLTRWQTETSLSVDTNIPEAFGYLAPEYIEYGIVTDKSDVYAFGVILLELITGRRAMDTSQPKGQQFLVEWARPLLSLASEDGQTIAVDRFLDPHLDRDQARFFAHQLRAMARAAALCLRRDPQSRPGMSKVLRILEGENVVDAALDFNTVGSRSSRMMRPVLRQENAKEGSLSYRFPDEAVISALCAERNWSAAHFNFM